MVHYQTMNVREAKRGWTSLWRGHVGQRMLRHLCLVLFIGSLLVTYALGQESVLTAQYDNSRSGANLNEIVLNTSNVNVSQFGRLFSRSLDGYLYAQPLYVPNVSIPGQGTHNIIYVATL